MQANIWLDKARELDRYRWMLLRERHGLLGSALRFAREALADWWFGIRAKRCLADSIEALPCDFLLLQSMPKVIPLQRKKLLKDALRARGHSLMETALQTPKLVLHERMLKRPPLPVPTRYFALAAHAEWLVERYQPRILLNDRNGSLYSPFLRLALNRRQRVLVHLAHATTVEASRRLGMNDYDYYFLFGQSSLEALQRRHLRFGSSVAVLAGSHMVDRAYDLPSADLTLRALLILGVGPDKEKEAGYQATYAMLREWAKSNSGYRVLVKAHPRSRVPYWREAAEALSNVCVLPEECGLAEALGQATVVVNIMSNAVIEAALAERAVVYANLSDDADIFQQERFFGPCVASVPALQQRLEQIESNYSAAQEAARTFSCFHLSEGLHGLNAVVLQLENLLAGRVCPGFPLSGTCPGEANRS